MIINKIIMLIMKRLYIILLAILATFCSSAFAAGFKGIVLSDDKTPVENAVVTLGSKSVTTTEDGVFEFDKAKTGEKFTVWSPGFYSVESKVLDSKYMKVYLIEESKYKYNESAVLPYRSEEDFNKTAANLAKKDFYLGSMSIDKALQGEIAGLQVTQKSGMTGEGAYMNIHGLRSLVAENSPLIVLNGVPYMSNMNESELINGYSRSIFQNMDINDIKNITVLTGADASLYGSLGSNGVILIETEGAKSNDLNTKISYYGSFGVNWNNTSLPLLGTEEYKSYLSDIGMKKYNNMEDFFGDFPFLTDPGNIHNYYYTHNTDWQDVINDNGIVTNHLLRVKGGDAIAKYDISLGYMKNESTLKNAFSERYHTQINGNVLVSKKFAITASINLAYLDGSYQEQGMSEETNPVLASYKKAPILSPYKQDNDGNLLAKYADYYFGACHNMDYATSNPLAIVEKADASTRQYDFNAKVAFDYNPTKKLALNANVGFYYNYDQEKLFMPGKDDKDILPLYDQYGSAENTVRAGVSESVNMFFGGTATYKTDIDDKNKLTLLAGGQVFMKHDEYDAGTGRNTANDFYETLSDVNSVGRYFFGYIDEWNWMNFYAHGDWVYNDLVKTSLNVSTDAASSTGDDADSRFGLFPSASVKLMAKNTDILSDVSFVNKLNFYVDYGKTGNSRFSSNYSKYYYSSSRYQSLSGIVRANVPNTKLKYEEDYNFKGGIDAAFFNNLLNLSVSYYNTRAKDVVMLGSNSYVFGTSPYYCNDGEINSSGIDLSLQIAPVYNKNFKWILGGNISTVNNEIKSLGSLNELKVNLSDDATLISRVGEDPYAFYGYKTAGVISSDEEAKSLNLKNLNGIQYEAGDMHYIDQNNDGYINDKDKVVIGSASPDFYGSFFNRFEYRNFALDLTFIYSVGNDAYNAVRRSIESSDDFSNQSKAVSRRWFMDGQHTDIPKASWGDPVGNNDFSDRWIEDASYLKLRDVTLSYNFEKPVFYNFFRSGTLYITGQNLFNITKYLGLDPEFSYSYSSALQGVDYAKVVLPKTIKIGVNLKF